MLSCVADIGTDHAHLPIWLVEQKITRSAIAMDLRSGPLLRAREHIGDHGLSEQIQVRQSDGLSELQKGEAEVIVIAGMGGETMQGILERGAEVLGPETCLVLEPQSELYAFRAFLERKGACFLAEDMICEDGKYYPMMLVRFDAGKKWAPYELKYGPLLLKEKHPVLQAYLTVQLEKKESLLAHIGHSLKGTDPESDRERRRAGRQRELEEEIGEIRRILRDRFKEEVFQ